MSNILEQKIVVVCDFSPRMKEVIVHGVRMAGILNKELCLTGIWKTKEQKTNIQAKLIKATEAIKENVPEMRVSSLLIKNSLRDNMEKLTWDYDAVLVVLHQSDLKSGLKAFRESSIAFLFVKGDSPEFLNYKNVLVPLDCRKASKETALWASFLGRHNHSKVHVIYACETDKEQAGNLLKNLNFIQKFLSNLNIVHQEIAGKSSSWGICSEAMNKSQLLKGDVMVFAGSAYVSMVDLLIGLPEKRIIQKAGELPILIINPRKEICVMCD
ncbi:MAG TPA: hypothetical protein VGK10_21310 [Prolixibacteraceae bacterium]|jgi:nucleotide-binding universal stress UspA family protein